MKNPDITVLYGHRSQETAHITFAYPFGRTRCLRREWIDQATQGSAKGRSRFVTQTTHKLFNGEYTDRIARDGIEAANAWAAECLANNTTVCWNKPHPSTYYPIVVMVAAPLDDGTGRIGTDYRALDLFPSLERLSDFLALFEDATPRFNEIEQRIFDQISRRAHASARPIEEETE